MHIADKEQRGEKRIHPRNGREPARGSLDDPVTVRLSFPIVLQKIGF